MNINAAQLTTIEAALTFTGDPHEALKVIGEIKASIAERDLLDAAKNKFVNDDVEVDDDAGTSPNDDGSWVQAWVYVRRETCECQWETAPEIDTGAIDCGVCHGSGVLGWEV